MRKAAYCLVVLAFAVISVHAAPAATTKGPREVPLAVKTAPAPDFWYVGDTGSGADNRYQMSGIVIPTNVEPRIETRGNTTVISWTRVDGSTQSFILDGVSAHTDLRGPIAGTRYIKFGTSVSPAEVGGAETNGKRLMIHWPDPEGTCCSCASWLHMSPNWEFRQCASGCDSCGCEGCICNPGSCGGFAAATGSPFTMTLTPHYRDGNRVGTPAEILTIERNKSIFATQVQDVAFEGDKLMTRQGANGQPEFVNPTSIKLGGLFTNVITRTQGDRSLSLVQSPGVDVIINQPANAPAATVTDHAIKFEATTGGARTEFRSKTIAMDTRCRMCGTYPQHCGDNERMVCTPGCDSTCYLCYEWNCDSAILQVTDTGGLSQ